jgi:hypothetical protein
VQLIRIVGRTPFDLSFTRIFLNYWDSLRNRILSSYSPLDSSSKLQPALLFAPVTASVSTANKILLIFSYLSYSIRQSISLDKKKVVSCTVLGLKSNKALSFAIALITIGTDRLDLFISDVARPILI